MAYRLYERPSIKYPNVTADVEVTLKGRKAKYKFANNRRPHDITAIYYCDHYQ